MYGVCLPLAVLIGYFLAELHQAIKDERYRLGALSAGRYLKSIISTAASSKGLIFHNDTAGQDLFLPGMVPRSGRDRPVFLPIVPTNQRSRMA